MCISIGIPKKIGIEMMIKFYLVYIKQYMYTLKI